MRRVVTLLLILMAAAAGCGQKKDQKKAQERGIPVGVAVVERATLVDAVPVTGTLKALNEAAVTPQVTARVMEVKAREGDAVAKGQVLVTLDQTDFLAQVKQGCAAVCVSKAQLAAARKRLQILEQGARSEERQIARSRLEQAEAGLRQAAADLERMRVLYQQGGVAKQQLDAAETAYDVARTNRDSARQSLELTEKGARPEEIDAARQEVEGAAAGLRASQASLSRAQEQLGYTVIRSPLSGVVYDRRIEPGEIASTMGGDPLLRIADLNSVYFEATVPERLAPQVHPGQRVTVTIHSDGEQSLEGTVKLLVPVADPESRNFLAHITIPKAPGVSRPGTYASGSIILEERRDAVVAPKDAIVERGSLTLVYVVKDKKVEERQVSIGLTDKARAQILSGVKVGEVVVVEGAQGVKNGDQVTVQQDEGA